jgi:RNA polymerase sigma factor (sigma-70 family)
MLAAAGDRDAFVRLVDAHANVVTRIALAIVRDIHASQDVAQEVFLVAWKDLRKLRNPESFLPWVRQVTRNVAHSWLREQSRVSDRDTEAILAAAVDPRLTPPELLEAAEQQRIVDEVIGSLPDDAREVITLYYSEGRSVKQVADLLGLSEVAVKKRMSRARERIREDLLERFGETLRRTAPGAAFTTAVAASLTIAGPSASAATAASAVKIAGGSKLLAVLLSALPGALLGSAAVLFGMRKNLAAATDEQERLELKRFGVIGVVTCVAAAFGFAIAGELKSVALLAATQVVFVAILGWMYARWLPRIIERRATGPQARRGRILCLIGLTTGATISTLTVLWAALRMAGKA